MGEADENRRSQANSAGEPEFDAFLSYAGEDLAWCGQLAERLRNEGVRIWFDQWQLQPGDHLPDRINDGLEKSRKMIAVWTPNYFRKNKVWTLAESYSRQHADILARDRLIVPLLLKDCKIKPTLQSLIYLDFRKPEDFELRLRQLIAALDLPARESISNGALHFREHEMDRTELGRLSQQKGGRFEDEVAKLCELQNFDVKRDVQISGMQIDLKIYQELGGLPIEAVVECKDTKVAAKERDQIIAQQAVVSQQLPACRWIVVSSRGFTADARAGRRSLGNLDV